jgi:hypothetical protein
MQRVMERWNGRRESAASATSRMQAVIVDELDNVSPNADDPQQVRPGFAIILLPAANNKPLRSAAVWMASAAMRRLQKGTAQKRKMFHCALNSSASCPLFFWLDDRPQG